MASYSVKHAKSATLVAATADTVTFAVPFRLVEVMNRGADYIYARLDGTAATVTGDDCDVVPGGQAAVFVSPPGAPAVSLISASATAYTVTAG